MSTRELPIVDIKSIRTENQIVPRRSMHGYGTVVRVYSSVRPTKEMCHGCRNDFYNGKNPYGVEECWSFDSAQVVDKVGYSSIHVCGGPDTKMIKTLHCWHGVQK